MPEPRGRTGEMEDWRKVTEQTDLPLGDLRLLDSAVAHDLVTSRWVERASSACTCGMSRHEIKLVAAPAVLTTIPLGTELGALSQVPTLTGIIAAALTAERRRQALPGHEAGSAIDHCQEAVRIDEVVLLTNPAVAPAGSALSHGSLRMQEVD
jgi:hypothetical protein